MATFDWMGTWSHALPTRTPIPKTFYGPGTSLGAANLANLDAAVPGGIELGGGISTSEAAAKVVNYPWLYTKDGGTPVSAETLNTMRASGGFTLPQELKQYLPLLLIFILVVLVLFKK